MLVCVHEFVCLRCLRVREKKKQHVHGRSNRRGVEAIKFTSCERVRAGATHINSGRFDFVWCAHSNASLGTEFETEWSAPVVDEMVNNTITMYIAGQRERGRDPTC